MLTCLRVCAGSDGGSSRRGQRRQPGPRRAPAAIRPPRRRATTRWPSRAAIAASSCCCSVIGAEDSKATHRPGMSVAGARCPWLHPTTALFTPRRCRDPALHVRHRHREQLSRRSTAAVRASTRWRSAATTSSWRDDFDCVAGARHPRPALRPAAAPHLARPGPLRLGVRRRDVRRPAAARHHADRRPLPLRRARLARQLPEPGLSRALRRLRARLRRSASRWVQLYTPVNEMFICAPFSARVRLVERAAARATAPSSPRSSTSSRPTCWRCRRSSKCVPGRDLHPERVVRVLPRRQPGRDQAGRDRQREALPLARPQLRPARRLGDVRVPDRQRHDARGIPLLPRQPRSSSTASWATTTTSPTSTACSPTAARPASGEVFGYYVITRQYYDRYRLPVMHTETNFCEGPNGDEAVFWLWKEWANVLRVRNDGVPIVGFTWYSLTDQVDWDTALRENNGTRQPARPVRPRPQHPPGRRGLQEDHPRVGRRAADAERLPARAGLLAERAARASQHAAARAAAPAPLGAAERRPRTPAAAAANREETSMRFEDKVVIVTGGARRHRPGDRRRFGGEGARVVSPSYDEAKGRRRRDAAARRRRAEALALRCDVANEADVIARRRRHARAIRPARRRRQQRRHDDLQADRGARAKPTARASCASTSSARSGSSSRLSCKCRPGASIVNVVEHPRRRDDAARRGVRGGQGGAALADALGGDRGQAEGDPRQRGAARRDRDADAAREPERQVGRRATDDPADVGQPEDVAAAIAYLASDDAGLRHRRGAARRRRTARGALGAPSAFMPRPRAAARPGRWCRELMPVTAPQSGSKRLPMKAADASALACCSIRQACADQRQALREASGLALQRLRRQLHDRVAQLAPGPARRGSLGRDVAAGGRAPGAASSGLREIARSTSRHITLPEPSQIELTGASRNRRPIGPVST